MKLAVVLISFMCLAACESEHEQRMRYYNMQLAGPNAQMQVYGASYAEHIARCKPHGGIVARNWCDMAKGEEARVQFAERQALAIYQQMAEDSLLTEQERQQCRTYAARLQSQLEPTSAQR